MTQFLNDIKDKRNQEIKKKQVCRASKLLCVALVKKWWRSDF